MSSWTLILRSVRHYWRTNIALILGVVIGTAVIGGALIVGDSVRDSLATMTRKRLGKVEFALTSHRFFREQLVASLQQTSRKSPVHGWLKYAPAVWLNGSLNTSTGGQESRAIRFTSNVNVIGVDERLWSLLETGGVERPKPGEIVINSRIGSELAVEAGGEIELNVEIPSAVPRETLLGERDEVAQNVGVTVAGVLADEDGASRFDINPAQQLPLTVFVDLDFLQELVGIDEVRPSRRNPTAKPARVNSIFVARMEPSRPKGMNGPDRLTQMSVEEATGLLSTRLNPALQKSMRIADLGMRVRPDVERGYLSFESDSLVMDEASELVAQRLRIDLSSAVTLVQAQRGQVRMVPGATPRAAWINQSTSVSEFSNVFVYLANQFANARDDTGGERSAQQCFSSYSVIAGIDLPSKAPFGPFPFVGEPVTKLRDNEIVINEWLAEDLQVDVGDEVRVRYFLVGSEGQGENGGLKETSEVFKVAGVVKLTTPAPTGSLTPSPAADPGMTPIVDGITDAESIDNWEQPFRMDMSRVTDRDDEYWEKYKTTPKAFINLKRAQQLFGSRYGKLSSMRVAVPGSDLKLIADDLNEMTFWTPTAAELGFVFQPVLHQGLQASSGANDFTGLFIGFSFFLIASAAILIGLLFRLNIDRRATEVGLLSTTGIDEKRIRRLFIGEGFLLALMGIVPGVSAAVGYAAVMMYGLRTWWIGATGTRFLELSVRPATLVNAGLASLLVSLMVVWFSVRRLRGYSAKDLMTGAADQTALMDSEGRLPWKRCVISLVLGGGLLAASLGGVVPTSDAFGGLNWQVVTFFVAAIALLVSGVSALSLCLQSNHAIPVTAGFGSMGRMGLRNASRHKSRSLFTVGLIAFATFVIVAVATGRRNPSAEKPDFDSGNGGYTFVAESAQPILHDLNSLDGRAELGIDEAASGQTEVGPAWPSGRVRVDAFRVKKGEDGSCLNLYQTRLPTVLGASVSFIERGGFRFANNPPEKPWELLLEQQESSQFMSVPKSSQFVTNPTPIEQEVPVYPVIGDMNTLQFSLKKGVGDVIMVPPVGEPEYALKVVGMLDSSVFQGVLLMSEENFKAVHPDVAGHRYFLVEFPDASDDDNEVREQMVETALESQVQFGFDVERVTDRIADFLAVQNTYLSTFQTLGGLGLLLGTLGLATVMLRNIIERRSELALMRAVGFRGSKLSSLVLIENALLLLFGLALGAACALLAMTPHLRSTGADVPWMSLGSILGGVFVVGMLAAWFAVREALKTPVLATLRAE